MIIDKITDHLNKLAQERAAKNRNVFTASSLSRDCKREISLTAGGVKGEPLTPRRVATLETGIALHEMFQRILQAASPHSQSEVRDSAELFGQQVRISIDAIDEVGDRLALVEFKTMSDFAFDRACEGNIDRSYLRQAWMYAEISGIDLIVFIGFRKETAHMVEIVFDKKASHVEIKDLTNAPDIFPADAATAAAMKRIAPDDQLLKAVITSPFDPAIATEVHDRIRSAQEGKQGVFEEGLMEGGVADEQHYVRGSKSPEYTQAVGNYGEPAVSKAGGHFYFKTGRKELQFPCSYCSFKDKCYEGIQMEVRCGKPHFIVPKEVA